MYEDRRYPPDVRRLNDLLRTELGQNPRYAWRWAEDLKHVMEVVDDIGRPEYVEQQVGSLTVLAPKTAVRRLLPFHDNCWVIAALVELPNQDGSIEGTGNHAWMPLSSGRSGVVSQEPGEKPTIELTLAVIDSVRQERKRTVADDKNDHDALIAKREKDRWNRAYDQIRDCCTAFYNVPGKRGDVSFGGI